MCGLEQFIIKIIISIAEKGPGITCSCLETFLLFQCNDFIWSLLTEKNPNLLFRLLIQVGYKFNELFAVLVFGSFGYSVSLWFHETKIKKKNHKGMECCLRVREGQDLLCLASNRSPFFFFILVQRNPGVWLWIKLILYI